MKDLCQSPTLSTWVRLSAGRAGHQDFIRSPMMMVSSQDEQPRARVHTGITSGQDVLAGLALQLAERSKIVRQLKETCIKFCIWTIRLFLNLFSWPDLENWSIDELTIGTFWFFLEHFSSYLTGDCLFRPLFLAGNETQVWWFLHTLAPFFFFSSFATTETAHKLQQLCKAQACSWAEGVPSLWAVQWVTHALCRRMYLITCFLCTRKRRVCENRSHVLPNGSEIRGKCWPNGSDNWTYNKVLMFFGVYLIISLVKIWHFLNAMLL